MKCLYESCPSDDNNQGDLCCRDCEYNDICELKCTSVDCILAINADKY